jgi:hypothetical protein
MNPRLPVPSKHIPRKLVDTRPMWEECVMPWVQHVLIEKQLIERKGVEWMVQRVAVGVREVTVELVCEGVRTEQKARYLYGQFAGIEELSHRIILQKTVSVDLDAPVRVFFRLLDEAPYS